MIVFTDKELYEYFRDKSHGLISGDIQPILVYVTENREIMVKQAD